MACLYHIRWPHDLKDIDSKYGWNTSLLKAMSPALCVFYQGNNEFHRNRPVTDLRSALWMINRIEGLQTLVTPLVMTMMQATQGWYEFDELKEFRALLPADLLEINDKYFEFMGERNVDYMPHDDEEDNSNNDDINPDKTGPMSFSDLLKLI